MKGIILAGGTGSRLNPLSQITNKHLVAVYDRPMIDYPLDTLIRSGIKEILIISGREHAGHFVEYLGSGRQYGANFTYKVQDEAGGIAQALFLAENFSDNGPVTVILGDNIFEADFSRFIKNFRNGARIFLKKVKDPKRFGVPSLEGKLVTKITEKPKKPLTRYAVTGMYQYDREVFEIIKKLKPSRRGELEITDVNNIYVKAKKMRAEFVKGFWSDMGTFDSLAKTIAWLMDKKLKPDKIII